MNDYAAFLLGVVCAGIGGELFVRGAVGMAHWARISPGIIGVTVAAFATSSPELSIAVSSSIAGKPQISLGDALGSNIVNVALILGIALIIPGIRSRRDSVKRGFPMGELFPVVTGFICSGIQSPRDSVKRDLPVAVLVPVVTGFLCFDGLLSRFDGLLMMGMFFVWLGATVMEARKQRSAANDISGDHQGWRIVLLSLAGLLSLFFAGKLIVAGARGIAVSFGLDEFIIGATIVAVGTSVPELATTIIAKLRSHDEVGLGTVLGSNIFNGLLVIAVAAIINPIHIKFQEVAVALVFGLAAVLLTIPPRQGCIERRRGVILLMLYSMYIAAVLYNSA